MTQSPLVVAGTQPQARRSRVDPWLLGILLLGLLLDTYRLDWGLPNGNDSWAADSIGPVTVLGIVHHTFAEWNSGWFFFKYPLGYPFQLAAVFSPYLSFLYMAGGWQNPATEYPYGFADAEHTLFVLAMVGRALSVAFALGAVAATYGIVRRLLGVQTARLAAFLVATAYPIIYYAHTTNLDMGYTFWLILALYAAIVASQSERAPPWVVLGVAAAMAVSSKEQGFAFLLPLPIMVLIARARALGTIRVCWSRPVWWMGAAAVGTALVANNVLFNPAGFVGRLAYLLGRPLQPIAARLAPVEFAFWKGSKEWVYVEQLYDALESSLGTPLLIAAAVGVLALWRRPRAAAWLLVPAVSLYYLSLRGLDLITLRYTLPLAIVAAVLAAALLVRLREGARGVAARGAATLVMLAIALLSLARAAELEWLFATDARYQAEAWMAASMRADTRAEVYQKLTYLPRFRDGFSAEQVPMEGRSIAGVQERRPDVIVRSSASWKSIANVWTPDWRATGTLLSPVPEAAELLRALENGDLPYRLAAVFRQEPRLLRVRITSLSPEIRIYVRDERADR